MDALLEQTATRILNDFEDRPDALWEALEENGLTRIWVPEADGGFDMTATEGFGLMRLAGAHGAAVPVAETLLATWFLTEAKLPVPEGQMSVAIDGFNRAVVFGGDVGHIVRVSDRSVSLHRGGLALLPGAMGDPAGNAVCLTDAISAGEMPSESALLLAALARAVQISGALDAVLTATIAFAEQREQFGRPLSKFQAIQHLISEMGSEAAAVSAIVETAVMTVRRGVAPDFMTIASAKCRAGQAATIVSEHAHQVHGAIGYTEEYGLSRLTQRLWQWRDDFGGEAFWANALGQWALRDTIPLWLKIADGDAQ